MESEELSQWPSEEIQELFPTDEGEDTSEDTGNSGYCWLDLLPTQILDKIISYIPPGSLGNLSQASKWLLLATNRLTRRRFHQLHEKTRKEMGNLRQELAEAGSSRSLVPVKIALHRSYYLLETMLFELDLIKVVGRKLLYHGNSQALGKIVEECEIVYRKSLRRELPIWTPENLTEKRMLKWTTMFYESTLASIISAQPYGSLVLDLLNIMMNIQYKLDVSFIPYNSFCIIDGIYKLESPKYLPRPPTLEVEGSDVPNREDKYRINSYLLNLIRINKRITLREEQYFREFEASTSNIALMMLGKVPEDRTAKMDCQGREVRTENDMVVLRATYNSPSFGEASTIGEEGLLFFVHLRCHLDQAPLLLLDSWKSLASAIMEGSISPTDSLDTKEVLAAASKSAKPDENSQENMEPREPSIYAFGCTIESSYRHSGSLSYATLTFHEPD